MKLLLDTCTFLWLASGDRAVSMRARMLFQSAEHEVYLSAVSGWEIAVKHALGRLPLPGGPAAFVPSQREALGVESLPLDEESALHLERLPSLHRDPFDRMLVCQAIVDGLVLVTPDDVVTQYPVRTLW